MMGVKVGGEPVPLDEDKFFGLDMVPVVDAESGVIIFVPKKLAIEAGDADDVR